MAARRSWLFVGGNDAAELAAAPDSGADVVILELEDFTEPAQRPRARAEAPALFAAWRAAGATVAVRVNPLEGDGLADLEAVMLGAPEIVLLPKVESADQVHALDREVSRLERALDLPAGATALVPNVETARGLRLTFEIPGASPRVVAGLVASEDMAADLGAERGRDGAELAHVRARFLVDCRAAGVDAIDCPYTWTDVAGLTGETRHARRLGYRAKSTVTAAHAAVINALLTPSAEEVAGARAPVAAFEAARAEGRGRVEHEGALVELPSYLNARRLLAWAAEIGVDG